MTVGEGHFRFVLATRKDSPIRNIADLKGKTVGALLGGDPYNVLSQMLRFELGNADPKAHGITVVNTPTQAQAATIPTGMDAAILIHPAFLKANAEIGTVGIMNSFGYTESHYKGPGGRGAGHLLESVKKSPFYPDGYYLHRSFWIGHPNFIKSHPALVTAFVLAQQDAVAKLSTMDQGQVSELAKQYWELDPKLGAKVVEGRRAVRARLVLADRRRRGRGARDLQVHGRGQADSEAARVVGAQERVRADRGAGARSLREERQQADAAAFTAKDAKDLRGLPVVGVRALERPHLIPTHPVRTKRGNMIVGFIGLGTMGGPMARNC